MVTVRLEPMTQSEYEAWRVVAVEQYSLEFVKSGILAESEARKRGESDFSRLLPDGPATAGHELYSAYDGTERVVPSGCSPRSLNPRRAPSSTSWQWSPTSGDRDMAGPSCGWLSISAASAAWPR